MGENMKEVLQNLLCKVRMWVLPKVSDSIEKSKNKNKNINYQQPSVLKHDCSTDLLFTELTFLLLYYMYFYI